MMGGRRGRRGGGGGRRGRETVIGRENEEGEGEGFYQSECVSIYAADALYVQVRQGRANTNRRKVDIHRSMHTINS